MEHEEHGRLLHSALLEAEGYAALGMWEGAWRSLEGLPDSLRVHPHVLSRSVYVLAKMDWAKAMRLSESLSYVLPERADTWFRMACICAELGDTASASVALRRCVELHTEWQSKAKKKTR
jgi:hypothetical protein